MATKKEQLGVRIDPDILKRFRAKCAEDNKNQGEVLTALMELYAKGSIIIKNEVKIELT